MLMFYLRYQIAIHCVHCPNIRKPYMTSVLLQAVEHMERLKSQKVEPPPEVHGECRLHHLVSSESCLILQADL